MASKHKILVHNLVKISMNENGVVEEALVQDVLLGLRENKPPRHREILKDYLAEISTILRHQIVEVELGCQVNDEILSNLKSKIDLLDYLSLDLQVSRNEKLIAGYRLRLVDDVFEDSIRSRLSKLSQTLTS